MMQYLLLLIMQQTADQSGSSSAALFPLWSLLARCLTMRMMMRMMMALLGRRLIWFWFFCSKQLKIHIHRFLIYPRHPTWSLMIVILWCLLSPLYAGNGIEHRPGGRDHQTHHQEPRIVGVVHIEHCAWRLWVKSPIFSTFSFLYSHTSREGVLGFWRLYSPTTGGPIKVATPCEWSGQCVKL